MLNDTVYWTNTAVKEFKSIICFIALDSVCYAEELSSLIFCQLYTAASNPKHFRPDKYKQNNDGSFRAFEINRYRIVYQVKEECIYVIRVRHTCREPEKY